MTVRPMERGMDLQKDGLINRQMDGFNRWMDGLPDGWMDGRMNH